MGAFSIWHWLIVLVVVLVLFGGRGKISSLMGDFGKGLKSFKKSMKEDDETPSEAAKQIKTESSSAENVTPNQDKAASG